ncbi:hypothetical protein [Helicobacter cinaedi]|nr:hypothetical protein [Helicobacter cinaedi]
MPLTLLKLSFFLLMSYFMKDLSMVFFLTSLNKAILFCGTNFIDIVLLSQILLFVYCLVYVKIIDTFYII